jgi:hypothetical protein
MNEILFVYWLQFMGYFLFVPKIYFKTMRRNKYYANKEKALLTEKHKNFVKGIFLA